MKAGAAGVFAAACTFLLAAPPLVWLMTKFDRLLLRRLSCWHPLGTYPPDEKTF
jgi:hypothetical protein